MSQKVVYRIQAACVCCLALAVCPGWVYAQQDVDKDGTQQSLSPWMSWPRLDTPSEVSAEVANSLGKKEFSISVWARHDENSAHLAGDIISQYDPLLKRGFHLTLKCNPGVTSNQANWRHLQFGIDDNRPEKWQDCGRPGKALFAFAMAAHEGNLFVGTCEPAKQDSGRVYRFMGPQLWEDCGGPDAANSVTAMAVLDNSLYVGTGRYRVAGSSLPESENLNPGGRVFRYTGKHQWEECGQLPDTEAIGGMVNYRGQLYASSLYKPAGFFRYAGGQTWTPLPVPLGPDPQAGNRAQQSDQTKDSGQVEQSRPDDSTTPALIPRRVVAMTVFDGYLYATSYDCGHVYRFDGNEWYDCGQVGDNTQTYAFTVYHGKLYVATWPSGRVFQFSGPGDWIDCGRLGEELEVMGMVVHNGRFFAGTLPSAQIYTYEGQQNWTLLEQLDDTPDVRYRRAWTMAEFGGRLFCSTLPSGKIYAVSQGRQVSWEHSLSSDWHHVVAVKSQDRLSLWLDGRQVSQSDPFDAAGYDLTSAATWNLGSGPNGPFHGQLRDLHVFQRALSPAEIAAQASNRPTD